MGGGECAFEDVQIDGLVFDERRDVRKAEVDEDLQESRVSGARTAREESKERTSSACPVRVVLGCRSIMLDVVRSPWITSARCIFAISVPIMRMMSSVSNGRP